MCDSPPRLLNISSVVGYIPAMRVLCVGRHPFLSEHIGRFFGELGIETIPCVGLSEAEDLVRARDPDAIICDYDLLATMPLASWESDPMLARVPLVAVSLTRHPGEAHLLDINSIAGFLYLPTLDRDDALRLLTAVQQRRDRINPPPTALQWPGSTPVARLR
jgi:DNA-binding NarL/FixJ family response regulator